MSDAGVWVKLEDAGSGAPGAAVIDDAASNYDSKDAYILMVKPTTSRLITATTFYSLD